MSADFKAAAERKTEEIIAICGAYVPGGWAHPGEECAEKITEVIIGAPAQQGVKDSTEKLLRSLIRDAVELAFVRHDLKSEVAITLEEEDDVQDIGQDVEHACFGESGCSEEPLPQIVEIMRRAAPAPPVSEGLKMDIQRLVGLPLDRECPDEIVLLAVKALHHAVGVYQHADVAKREPEIESHGVTFLNPPLIEEEAERAKELKASQQAAERESACDKYTPTPGAQMVCLTCGPREPDTKAGPRCPNCGSGRLITSAGGRSFLMKIWCEDCPESSESFYPAKLADFAQFFPLPSPEQGWVSVEKKLPELETIVLIASNEGGTFTGKYRSYGGKQFWMPTGNGTYAANWRVTHWMPLPAPPRPSTEEGKS